MPILDFGRTSARVDQARALNQQSLISWQNALQVAYKDVRDALVNLREDGEPSALQASQLANARHTLGLAHLRLQTGHASLLDVLDSQRTFNDAQLAYITTRQAQLNASVRAVQGAGWRLETGDWQLSAARRWACPARCVWPGAPRWVCERC